MNYFCLYLDMVETFEDLTDEEAGLVIKSLLAYCNGQEVQQLSGGAKIVFGLLRRQFERDSESYESKRLKLSENGRKGGRPKANETKENQLLFSESKKSQEEDKEKDKEKDKEEDKDKKKEKADALASMFARFWAVYPRKEAKQTALKAFTKINPDEALLATILSAVERFKNTAQWQEDGGQYVPHPSTFLNQRRWEDEPPKGGAQKKRKDDYDQRPNDEPDGNTVPLWLQKRREQNLA
jgi:hypothetical protein